jgi:hypothetical protein
MPAAGRVLRIKKGIENKADELSLRIADGCVYVYRIGFCEGM